MPRNARHTSRMPGWKLLCGIADTTQDDPDRKVYQRRPTSPLAPLSRKLCPFMLRISALWTNLSTRAVHMVWSFPRNAGHFENSRLEVTRVLADFVSCGKHLKQEAGALQVIVQITQFVTY